MPAESRKEKPRGDTTDDQFHYLLAHVVIPFRIIEFDIDKPKRRRTSEKTPRKIDISELLRDVSERRDENEDGEEGEEDEDIDDVV